MNIEFTSAHMQTLIELKAIAEKHGCRITFGVDSWAGVDPEFEKFDGYTSEIHEELNDKGNFSNGVIDTTKFWFELCDPNNKERQYHYLEYTEGEKEEIAKVEKLDDRGLADYIDALPNCSPCIFDSRKCNDYCCVRIFKYLLNHGDEEVEE